MMAVTGYCADYGQSADAANVPERFWYPQAAMLWASMNLAWVVGAEPHHASPEKVSRHRTLLAVELRNGPIWRPVLGLIILHVGEALAGAFGIGGYLCTQRVYLLKPALNAP